MTKPQDHALQLPKTFVTRKGAMLLFAQNGTHTMLDQEKQHRNNEKIKVDASVIVEEQMPPAEKRKMFLGFLMCFSKMKQETNMQILCQSNSKKITGQLQGISNCFQ